ncbi:hypothetical protein [Streptomyces sp. NPDC048521]|uniref:hypothetical protein n=1 Tax=Streptomyces sp. NPDC048521 TaxID=3365566 RepID=UPI003711587B
MPTVHWYPRTGPTTFSNSSSSTTDNAAFVHDYGGIDLREVRWQLETIPAADFNEMPTGASDAGCIESYAENPVHWVKVRRPEVGRHWEEPGRGCARRS